MKMQKQIVIGFFLLTFILVGSLAHAAEQKIALQAGPDGKGSHGQAVITDKAPDQKEIAIEVNGLTPNSVYTVWLVNMKPTMDMIGVGVGDYSFKSDDKGNGRYVATVAAEELGKWQALEIAHHPDGDPKNMKTMGIALKAELK